MLLLRRLYREVGGIFEVTTSFPPYDCCLEGCPVDYLPPSHSIPSILLLSHQPSACPPVLQPWFFSEAFLFSSSLASFVQYSHYPSAVHVKTISALLFPLYSFLILSILLSPQWKSDHQRCYLQLSLLSLSQCQHLQTIYSNMSHYHLVTHPFCSYYYPSFMHLHPLHPAWVETFFRFPLGDV